MGGRGAVANLIYYVERQKHPNTIFKKAHHFVSPRIWKRDRNEYNDKVEKASKQLINDGGYSKDEFKKRLNSTDIESLIIYTDKYHKGEINYMQINSKLREKSLSEIELTENEFKWYNSLRDSIDKYPTKNDMIVYRGFALTDKQLNKANYLKEGSVITEGAFMSTSINLDTSEHYADLSFANNKNAKRVIFEIVIPKGMHAVYLNDITADNRDYEYLFKNNCDMIVKRVIKENKNSYYVEMEMIRDGWI